MDADYLDIILWVVGSAIAIKILFVLMRQRRDQLVEQLRTYVDQQLSDPQTEAAEIDPQSNPTSSTQSPASDNAE